MNDPFLIFAIVVAIVLFYIIPIAIIYFVYTLTKKKLNMKIANSILVFMTVVFLFLCYADFYPLENSYTRNFKEKTGLHFPKPAKYLEKISENSIFDFGGEMYCSKIQTTKESYLKLRNEIENSKFIMVSSYTQESDSEKIFSKIKNSDIEQTYRLRTSLDEYFVIFLADKKTIILFYRRWI
jgi:hypothetical protein